MRAFVGVSEKRSPNIPPLVFEELQRLWPLRASKFVCVFLAGISKRLAGPRVLEGDRCRCCGTD